MEKIKFMTDEILTSTKPDVSILETLQSKKYLNELYANKGKVLCVPSPHSDRYDEKQIVFTENKMVHGSEHPHIGGSGFFDGTVTSLFNFLVPLPMLVDTVYKDQRLVTDFNRIEVEHNPQYWQLVVCGVIKTKNGILILMNKDTHPRLPNLVTMVQGHVEPSPEMHFMSSIDYLTREFAREVMEEINIPKMDIEKICENTKLLGAIQVNTDAVAMEHLGIVFMFDMTRCDEVHSTLMTTNEKTKHDLGLITSEEDLKNFKLDSWVGTVLKEFLSEDDWK